MSQMDEMDKIDSTQVELCKYLISMIPVEWSKLCLYGKVGFGGSSISAWMALVEKKTGQICTQESFGKRYKEYPYDEMEALTHLCDLVENVYYAYLEKFGEDKIWCTYYLTINEDYTFHVDLGYEMPKGNMIEQHDAVFRKFFNCEYEFLEGKYPY